MSSFGAFPETPSSWLPLAGLAATGLALWAWVEWGNRPTKSSKRIRRNASKWRKISGPGEYGMWAHGKRLIEAPTGSGYYELSYDGKRIGSVRGTLRMAQAEWRWS